MNLAAKKTSSFAIVIPTAGRTAHLASCLASLNALFPSGLTCNILIIDNNGDSCISCIVKDLCGHYPGFEYYYCPKPGLTSARHFALGVTSADVLCFVDDDVLFEYGWLDSVFNTFQDRTIALSGGPSVPLFSGSVPAWFWDFITSTPYGGWCNSWLSLLDIGRDIDNIHPNWIWGLNFSIRRDVLLDCGGFHVDLVPHQFMRWQGDGETGLATKLAKKGYKAVYKQDSLLYHQCGQDRLTPAYFEKRAYYQGVCNAYSILRRIYRDKMSRPLNANFACFRHRIGARLRRVMSSFEDIIHEQLISNSRGPDAPLVRALCRKAELDGYLFLIREASKDPDLRKWISMDTYFDVDLRTLLSE